VNATDPTGSGLYTRRWYTFTTKPLNNPPVANYTYELNDLNVTFTSTSSDPDGNIVNWTWNFDDGTPLSFKPNPQHTYVDERIYNVTLTVKDNECASNSITKKINVTNNPPVADFVYALVGGSKHVRFDASNSSDINGTIVSYFWEFGDGKNSTDVIVGHDYERDYTTYKVNLTVTDGAGLTNTISKNVTIGDVTSPTIKITKPAKKTIYTNNQIKRQRLFGVSIVIGDITIEVDAKDNNGSGIAKVEFYVNGVLKGNDTTAPYTYNLTKYRILRFFHMQIIKVVAYDKAGNRATDRMVVRKLP
jgi:PKD repeat protein